MSQLIVNILDSFLGNSHRHNSDSGQLQYDCPACSEEKGLAKGDGKGNLEINYLKGLFRCWSCYDTNNMGGTIYKLIKRYGSVQNLRDYELVNPHAITSPTESLVEILTLPEGYTPLTGCDPSTFRYGEVMRYLKKRGITSDIIEKYRIGFTTIGLYANRIIIPSYNLNYELDFFIGRAFLPWVKPKYLNPKIEKTLIHFNESLINWNSTIYLVEGPFDAIVVPNSIPLLGKIISEKLLFDLQYKATGLVVIVLDGDAYKDAIKLYKKLNTMNLYNRVRIVLLGEEWDISLVNEKLGLKGVFNVLKSSTKLLESVL